MKLRTPLLIAVLSAGAFAVGTVFLWNFFAPVSLSVASRLPPPLPVDMENQLDAYIDQYRSLIIDQYNSDMPVSLFDGWTSEAMLQALLDDYLVNNKQSRLDDFVYFSELLIKFRADKRGVKDFSGSIKPQWYRIPKYNIFSYSPFFSYDSANSKKIMEERGWYTLYHSDVNHDGLYLWPMLRFASIVKSNPVSPQKYVDFADFIITSAQETVSSHENEWHQISEESGYYTFPYNSTFYLDGVEMPVNEAAPFGTTLVYLYELTQDSWYLERAKAMVLNWFDYVNFHGDLMVQPYVTGDWYRGWSEENSPSVNTPAASPNTLPEVFHKSSLTVSLLNRISGHVDDERIYSFLDGFRDILNESKIFNGKQIAFFPYFIDMQPAPITYHVYNPAVMRGLAEIADYDTWSLMYLMAYAAASQDKEQSRLLPLLELYKPDGVAIPKIKMRTDEIAPNLIGSTSRECQFKADHDMAVAINFQRKSPKHNWLHLSTVDASTQIRLESEPGSNLHKGMAYLKAGDCVQWTWVEGEEREYSQPSGPFENRLMVTLYSIEE